MRDAADVTSIELGSPRRPSGSCGCAAARTTRCSLLRLVSTLIASEVERVRAPERASEEAARTFQRAVLRGQIENRDDLLARGKELGTDLSGGGSVVVVRAHPRTPAEDDWRQRLLAVAGRGARSIAPGSIAAPVNEDAGEVIVLVPDHDGDSGRRGSRPRCCASSIGTAGVRVCDRPQPPGRQSGRAAPRRERGAAGGECRRG